MKRALVTGGNGFLGQHFRAMLADDGWDVTSVDIAGPLASRFDVRDFRNGGPGRYDLVVHCAAMVGGRVTIENEPLTLAANLSIDAELFGWAVRRRQAGRILYVSSSAVYPVDLQGPDALPLIEDDVDLAEPRLPDRLYGWAKLTGEVLAALARQQDVPVTVVRPFSGYGPGQSPDYPFAAFAHRAAVKADPFEVWGDGWQVRDWVHVSDIVGASMAAIEHGTEHQPVNIGTGRPVNMTDLARMFCEAAGYRPVIAQDPSMPAGVARRVADTAVLDRFYSPVVTLEEGIWRTLRSKT